MIKTFRGLMADNTQDTIALHTNNGEMGYRIVNFQLFPATPGTTNFENVVKIYKISQSSISGTVDFSDNTLLAVGSLMGRGSSPVEQKLNVIFDQEVFNQDIYITHTDADTGEACNYYIELEQFKLDLNENTVATLKDIRNLA